MLSVAFPILKELWLMGRPQLQHYVKLRKKRLLVDMHCDESDDPLSRHVENLAKKQLVLASKGVL